MPKAGDKREDGFIWSEGKWRSPAAIERSRLKRRIRNKLRGPLTPEQKQKRAEIQRNRRRKNPESFRKAERKYYEANKEQRDQKAIEHAKKTKYRACHLWQNANREKVNETSNLAYRNSTPTYGLKRTISEYRRGRIQFDEVVRRLSDASHRADEFISKKRESRKQSNSTGSSGSNKVDGGDHKD